MRARRLALLRGDAATAPHAGGVLIVDENGDRKDGDKTTHVGRQELGNRGTIEHGDVSVGSLGADERGTTSQRQNTTPGDW